MDALRIFTALLILTFVEVTDMYCRDRSTVVADSLTRQCIHIRLWRAVYRREHEEWQYTVRHPSRLPADRTLYGIS